MGGLIDRMAQKWDALRLPSGALPQRPFCAGLGESGNFPAAIKTVAEWFPRREMDSSQAGMVTYRGSSLGGWLPARFLAAAWSLNRVARDRHARLCPCCGSNPGPRQRSKPMSAIILISLAAVAHRVWSADTYVGSGA
jgi:MFS family permease